MNDRERAKALADEIGRFRLRHTRDGVSGDDDALCQIGDVALANEGDLWMALFLLRKAAGILRDLTAAQGAAEPPQDLREVVAKAIYGAHDHCNAEAAADAALSAILEHHAIMPREPSKAMVDAAFAELPPMTNGEGNVLDDAECREHIADALRAALVEYGEKGDE